MPAKSKAQQHMAGMSKTPKGRAMLRARGIKPMPMKVADEYAHTKTRGLPKHKRKK